MMRRPVCITNVAPSGAAWLPPRKILFPSAGMVRRAAHVGNSGSAGSWLPSRKPPQQRSNLQAWLLNRNRLTLEPESLSQKDCGEWLPFLSDALPDPYVELTVYKRSSYVAVTPSGEVKLLPKAPMTQSKEYNITEQADQERLYLDLQTDLVQSPSFQEFVRHWSDVHGLGANEPILVANIQTRIEPFAEVDADGDGLITREEYKAKTKKEDFNKIDSDGSDTITLDEYKKATSNADPLSGQSIHRDGMQAVSVLCISRENCEGAISEFYDDHAGTRMITSLPLQPGECVHFQDLNMFHNVTQVRPIDPAKVMHRSVMVLLSRFQDDWWHANMEEQYGKKGYTCIRGKGELEMLFDMLDADGNGQVDYMEFRAGLQQIAHNFQELLDEAHLDTNGQLRRAEFIACLEKLPMAAMRHQLR